MRQLVLLVSILGGVSIGQQHQPHTSEQIWANPGGAIQRYKWGGMPEMPSIGSHAYRFAGTIAGHGESIRFHRGPITESWGILWSHLLDHPEFPTLLEWLSYPPKPEEIEKLREVFSRDDIRRNNEDVWAEITSNLVDEADEPELRRMFTISLLKSGEFDKALLMNSIHPTKEQYATLAKLRLAARVNSGQHFDEKLYADALGEAIEPAGYRGHAVDMETGLSQMQAATEILVKSIGRDTVRKMLRGNLKEYLGSNQADGYEFALRYHHLRVKKMEKELLGE